MPNNTIAGAPERIRTADPQIRETEDLKELGKT